MALCEFISWPAKPWALFPSCYIIRNWEDGHRLRILWNQRSQLLIRFLSPSFPFFWTCLLPPLAAVGSQFFLPDTSHGGEGPAFSPLHAPLPPQDTHHSRASADVATCPHEYTSFVHWKAQILRKELLSCHLAICEFFSSLDVCEKAETWRLGSEPFISHSVEEREKDQNQFIFTRTLSFKVLAQVPGSVPTENWKTSWMYGVIQDR